jgi:hypothetical protein
MYQSECCYNNNITTEEDKFSQNEFFSEQAYHTLHSKKICILQVQIKVWLQIIILWR